MLIVEGLHQASLYPALTLLFQALPRGEREHQLAAALSRYRQHPEVFEFTQVAVEDEKVVGVLRAARFPGAVAFVWPPQVRLTGRDPGTTAGSVVDALFHEATRRFDLSRIELGQFLVPEGEQADAELLARHGFVNRVDLQCWSYSLEATSEPAAGNPPAESSGNDQFLDSGDSERFQVHRFAPGDEERFAALLSRTYIGSADCPVLRRNSLHALASHQGTGLWTPEHWWIYHTPDDDAGLVLVNVDEQRSEFEVVYFGIAPEYRGAGLGKCMLQDMTKSLRSAESSHLLAFADSANRFANDVYEATGFVQEQVRTVFLRLLLGLSSHEMNRISTSGDNARES